MKNIDLNQLIIFKEIFNELNITRAAENLKISQSTASKEISKLRHTLNDPLFIRKNNGVLPTHKSKEIYAKISDIIAKTNEIINDDKTYEFDPKNIKLNFNIATTEYISFILVSELIKKIKGLAPNIKIIIHDIGTTPPEDFLFRGEVDLVLSSISSLNYPLHKSLLFKDHYVCLLSAGNPHIDSHISIHDFCTKLQHIGVPGHNGSQTRLLANTLQNLNLTRTVAVQIPHFLSIPNLLKDSNFVITIAEKLAIYFQKNFEFKILPHPLPLEEFEIHQIWHQRTHDSASLQWLRKQIKEVAKEL